MKALTKAQAAMLKRAQEADFICDGFVGDKNLRSYCRLGEISRKYDKPFFGATRLHGSGDFRTARAVHEAGLGRVVSCPVADGYWLIAEVGGQ